VAKHDSNTIIKFADDITVLGLITDSNETAYREGVRELSVRCQDNNLFLRVSKTKTHIMDYRKRRAKQAHININESFKLLGVHITNKLSWSKHTKTVVKRARQNPFPLRRLKLFCMGPQRSSKRSTGCITAWYGNCSASD
jgi:hypothetical protein